MIKILTTLAIFCGLSTAHALNLGTKLELLRTEAGSPSFGATYLEAESVLWISFSVRGASIVGNRDAQVSPVYYSFVDLESGEFISPWMKMGVQGAPVRPEQEFGFQMDIGSNAPVSKIIKSLKNSALVFSFRQLPPELKPAAYLDLKELCLRHPEVFSDADSSRKGCP